MDLRTINLGSLPSLTESPELAETRAGKIAGILSALGVDPKVTEVSWASYAIAGKGADDRRNRKVEIAVTP